MINLPLVSVVIPNYNHARYLGERIQSVLNQTYQHFELIFLDDCSTDNSREVMERYRANEHVSHIVYNDVNSGSTFKQWDKGISLAKGQLIWIAESDDRCEPTLLEKLVQQFEKNENLVMAFCKTIAFTNDGKEQRLDPLPLLEDNIFEGSEFISLYMSHGNPVINASSCTFKKDVVLNIDRCYETFKGAGDRLFWIEISEHGKVTVVNEWLNYMRSHANNSTKRFNHDGINQIEDKQILDYIREKGYISPKRYQQLKHDYVKAHIFEMLTDKPLKQKLYAIWGYNIWDQLSLRLEAWFSKVCKMIHK